MPLPEIFHRVLDLVYPNVCIASGEWLAADEKFISRKSLAGFDAFLVSGEDETKMLAHLGTAGFDGTVAGAASRFYFHKASPFQHVIHGFKYDGLSELAVYLGTLLGDKLRTDERFASADALIPVPLHKSKFLERGYNQSERLAAGVSQKIGVPVWTTVLHRTRYTETQTGFDAKAREQNMSDAFEVPPSEAARIAGKRLVLIDDVFTTGSTLLACVRALRAAGCDAVYLTTLAIASS
jgi:ComF family protein